MKPNQWFLYQPLMVLKTSLPLKPWPPDGNAPRSQLRPPRRSGGRRQSAARAAPWQFVSCELWKGWLVFVFFSPAFQLDIHLWEILPLRIQDSRGFKSSEIEFITGFFLKGEIHSIILTFKKIIGGFPSSTVWKTTHLKGSCLGHDHLLKLGPRSHNVPQHLKQVQSFHSPRLLAPNVWKKNLHDRYMTWNIQLQCTVNLLLGCIPMPFKFQGP